MFKTDANVPKVELYKRIANLQNALQEHDMDAALILQTSDLYYFSGTIQRAHLYIPCQGEPLLMVQKDIERARAESALEIVIPLGSAKKILDLLTEKGLDIPQQLGLEMDVMPVAHFRMYEKIFSQSFFKDISPAVRSIRTVKSEFEIDLIRRAAVFSDQVAAQTRSLIQPGMTELELAGLVEGYARSLGHQGIVRMRMWGGELFYGHLMTGASAAVSSFLASPTGGRAASPAVAQGAGYARIEHNQPILLDYVFAYNGYISDHTRIFSLGALPEMLMSGHAAMLEIQDQLIKTAKPGVKAHELYDLGVDLATRAGFGDYFMGTGANRIRFIGHGVGLELDEPPVIAQSQTMRLERGMVIALEPKLIIPGKGVVGIENTHLVTSEGLEQLGQYPDEITIL